jgi:hypothetical protein
MKINVLKFESCLLNLCVYYNITVTIVLKGQLNLLKIMSYDTEFCNLNLSLSFPKMEMSLKLEHPRGDRFTNGFFFFFFKKKKKKKKKKNPFGNVLKMPITKR